MILFSMQIRASVLILVIVLIRSLFLYKFPKKVFMSLWALAAARLLIPYSQNISLGFSFPNIEPLWSSFFHWAGPANDMTASGSVASITLFSIPDALLWIWSAGCAGLAVYFIVSHIKGRRIYRFAYPIESAEMRDWAAAHKIRRQVRILRCPEIRGAVTYGVFRPVILLPKEMDSENNVRLRSVLSHELEHIRHFDVLWKWMSAAVLCLNWYNPLVWAMYVLLNRDIELHCDECVLKRMRFGKKRKSDYALALLSLAEENNRTLPLAGHFSKNAVEERILSVMYGRLPSRALAGMLILGIAVLALLAFATFYRNAEIAFTLPIK